MARIEPVPKLADLGTGTLKLEIEPTPPPGPKGDGVKVGDEAPGIMALHSDGDGVELILMGKVVVVAFWELDLETGTGMPIKTLFDLCREFSKEEDFLIITVCSWTEWDAWMGFLARQGRVDYGDGRFGRFYSNRRWWNSMQLENGGPSTSQQYGVRKTPDFFVIGRDGRLAAAYVPPASLRDAVTKALKMAPPPSQARRK